MKETEDGDCMMGEKRAKRILDALPTIASSIFPRLVECIFIHLLASIKDPVRGLGSECWALFQGSALSIS